MKILIVNQVFYPDVSATAQYLTDLALELSKQNHKITVLTARCGYTAPWPLYSKTENYQGIHIVRVWPFRFNKKSRFMRVLQSLGLNLSFALKMLQLPGFDRILALTSPPMVGWICALLAGVKKKKFYYWLMDINPDEAIAAGWIRKEGIRARFLSYMLKASLRRSNRIICLDSFMEKRIAAKGVYPNDIRTLPPWSHDEDLEAIPHESNPFRQENHLEGKFVVMYAGNHSVCHPLDTLLEAAVKLKDDPSIKFVFIGGGERSGDVSVYKEKYNLSNVIQLGYQARSGLKFLLSAANLHIVVMGNEFVGIVHPCKIYDILTAGRPFVYIGPEESHVTQIMHDHKVGYEVRHGQAKELAEIIKAAMRLGESEKASIMRSEKAAAQRFSQQILCSQLADIITSE